MNGQGLSPPVATEFDYTIAICTWNRAERLGQTLTRLLDLKVPEGVSWQLLVVDNNSTDHTQEVLRRFEGVLPLKHCFEPRQGKSYALNLAVRHATGRWILWTDDDVLVPSDWLATYHAAIATCPGSGFFGGPTVARLDAEMPAWLRDDWSFLRYVYGDRDLGDTVFDIDDESLPWGANFAIRTSLQRLYSFDPRLGRAGKRRLSGEESELCRALLRSGINGKWLPSACVQHCLPDSSLTRGYVYRYYIGQGETRARKRIETMRLKPRLRQLLRLGKLGAKLLLTGARTQAIDMLTTVEVCMTLGDIRESVFANWARLRTRIQRSGTIALPGDTLNNGDMDTLGRTALHLAAGTGDVDGAVALLSAGANWQAEDSLGRTPLDLGEVSLEFLHRVRQGLRRHRSSMEIQLSPSMQHHLYALNRDGITRIPAFLRTPTLEALQMEFQSFVAALERRVSRGEGLFQRYDEEEHWWDSDQAYITNNAFKHCPTLAKLCCSPDLMTLSDAYFGASTFITRAVGMRYLPTEERSNDMFGWHHDMEDKRLKLMVLLTDVTAADQSMSYALGTHRLRHDLNMFLRNAISLDHCRKTLKCPIILQDTVGKAGDVFLFDSNGAHRGNRRPHASIRDALFVEYCTDTSDIWGADLDLHNPDNAEVLANPQLAKIASAPKKWNLRVGRSAPTWIETLPHLALWLPSAIPEAHGRANASASDRRVSRST
jgi:glucosyl-dolichyl phosphate glucuronosyltransferase